MDTPRISLNIDENDIPCMLLPLKEHVLLVPTVSIAEMAPMSPVASAQNTPDWFYGYYDWRGHQLPVISYEGLNGESIGELKKEGRIAVFNNTASENDIPYFAIATQTIPRMVRVGQEDIRLNDDAELGEIDLMKVFVGVENLAIPNVGQMEKRLVGVVNV